jgi:hypothetical protein
MRFGREALLRVPAHLAGDEHDAAGLRLDAVGVADGRRPASGSSTRMASSVSRVARRVRVVAQSGGGAGTFAARPCSMSMCSLLLGLQRCARAAHLLAVAAPHQRGEEVARLALRLQRDLQRVPGLHEVVRLLQVGAARGRLLRRGRGRLLPAHAAHQFLGMPGFLRGELAEQRRRLAVVVRLQHVGEFGVALHRLALEGAGLRHQVLQRARGGRGLGVHSANSASSSRTVRRGGAGRPA